MLNLFWIFLGGGLGSVCRYGISKLLAGNHFDFPFATLLANIISCIILGCLFGVTLKNGLTDNAKLLWMTGFCGGFSTFSTFSIETFLLFESGQTGYALLNIGVSLLVCLLAIYIGIKISGNFLTLSSSI